MCFWGEWYLLLYGTCSTSILGEIEIRIKFGCKGNTSNVSLFMVLIGANVLIDYLKKHNLSIFQS